MPVAGFRFGGLHLELEAVDQDQLHSCPLVFDWSRKRDQVTELARLQRAQPALCSGDRRGLLRQGGKDLFG